MIIAQHSASKRRSASTIELSALRLFDWSVISNGAESVTVRKPMMETTNGN